jgi:hypothetical protein
MFSVILAAILVGTLPFGYEHSGIEVDSQGNIYTHPDSGNSNHLYKFSSIDKGEWMWVNKENTDWEDISIGECLTLDLPECIYLADTGQNAHKHRPKIFEIDPNDMKNIHTHRVDFEGGNGDVEAIAFSNGELYAIKKDGRSDLYRLEGVTFNRCGSLEKDKSERVYVTGMDIKGDHLVVSYHIGRDYYLKEYVMNGCEVLSSQKLDFHSKRQIEGVAYNGDSIVAVAEDGTVFMLTQ